MSRQGHPVMFGLVAPQWQWALGRHTESTTDDGGGRGQTSRISCWSARDRTPGPPSVGFSILSSISSCMSSNLQKSLLVNLSVFSIKSTKINISASHDHLISVFMPLKINTKSHQNQHYLTQSTKFNINRSFLIVRILFHNKINVCILLKYHKINQAKIGTSQTLLGSKCVFILYSFFINTHAVISKPSWFCRHFHKIQAFSYLHDFKLHELDIY